jgi:hypothetical protein
MFSKYKILKIVRHEDNYLQEQHKVELRGVEE